MRTARDGRAGTRPVAYGGDGMLAGLLKAAGIDLPVDAVRELVAGVNAAPEGADPDGWMVLLGTAPDALPAALREQLAALGRQLADAMRPEQAPDRAGRLADLRAELARRGLSGFVVPRSDEHQGEYVPARAERLAWVTGFTGSAGLAVVLAERAAVFVDGRYTLQVRAEVPSDL
ncbi:MAG TPA: aminopeptidase P family N-terminal domain-containing protein, partial [Arenibaculum sp.]|nr:aminopeptidase P family N-terminal domain-containing protein [Arenibaculum sp.]